MTRKQSIGLIILLSFFSLFIVLININDFIYLKSSNYTDIAISHFPNLLFIQHSIIEDHQIPLWSNLIQSGYPFAANPLSGIWYLFGWIAVIFPLPMGININLAIHILFTFIGLFLFLRDENRSYPAAIFGALVFSISTRMFSHLGAGHLTLIYAVSWTPWLLLVTKRYSRFIIMVQKAFSGHYFRLYFHSRSSLDIAGRINLVFLLIQNIPEIQTYLSVECLFFFCWPCHLSWLMGVFNSIYSINNQSVINRSRKIDLFFEF